MSMTKAYQLALMLVAQMTDEQTKRAIVGAIAEYAGNVGCASLVALAESPEAEAAQQRLRHLIREMRDDNAAN